MKIGFFIDPQNILIKKIIYWKKEIKNKFGKQVYLNHLPHATICTMELKKSFINILEKKNYEFEII